jgi:hypothetical protein
MLTSSFKKSFNATPIGISMSTFFNLGARIRRMNHLTDNAVVSGRSAGVAARGAVGRLPPHPVDGALSKWTGRTKVRLVDDE